MTAHLGPSHVLPPTGKIEKVSTYYQCGASDLIVRYEKMGNTILSFSGEVSVGSDKATFEAAGQTSARAWQMYVETRMVPSTHIRLCADPARSKLLILLNAKGLRDCISKSPDPWWRMSLLLPTDWRTEYEKVIVQEAPEFKMGLVGAALIRIDPQPYTLDIGSLLL